MLINVVYVKLRQLSSREGRFHHCFQFESFINFATIAATPACTSFPTGSIFDSVRLNPCNSGFWIPVIPKNPFGGGNSMVYE